MSRAGSHPRGSLALAAAGCVALAALFASQAVLLVPANQSAVILREGQAVLLVPANQSAVILREGQAVRVDNADGRAPGLYLKMPVLERAVRLDRRTLIAESRVIGLPGGAGERLDISALTLYRIADARLASRDASRDFTTKVAEWVDSAVRKQASGRSVASLDGAGRAALSEAVLASIRQAAAQERSGLAIQSLQVIDVAPAGGEAADLQHLQSDLAVRAAQVRADGESAKQQAIASADREAANIRANGEQQALEIRGQGDAQRAEILGAAYAQDPDFARFFRRLEAYDQALDPATTTLVLNGGEGFLDLFGKGPDKATPGR